MSHNVESYIERAIDAQAVGNMREAAIWSRAAHLLTISKRTRKPHGISVFKGMTVMVLGSIAIMCLCGVLILFSLKGH